MNVSNPLPLRELTVRAVVIGALLSVVMGAANVYLGLRAGITVSASIPAAVVSMVILRKLLRNGTILENNQVQTAASAGESLAAGIIFTMPALVMVGIWTDYDFWMTTAIALAGGWLGVLFMIPMRRIFITRASRELTYPEGVACAEVLRAGDAQESDSGGAHAILIGGLLGGAIKLLESFGGILRGTIEGAVHAGNRIWYFGSEALPALIGVGFILKLPVASSLFLGAALSWLVCLPLLSAGVAVDGSAVDAAYAVWSSDIRYIGVGAMLVGGILTVWRVREGIVAALRAILPSRQPVDPATDAVATERNLPSQTIAIASIIAIVLTGGIYFLLLEHIGITLLTTVLMLIAGFFFAAVASYIVGLVGNSNSPVSGMTITAVLFTGLLLLLFGFDGTEGMLATLGVAAVVCCIACTSGDVCNDLKTGHMVGATPWKQQIMQFIGVGVAAFALAPVLSLLHNTTPGGVGGENLPAPQAALFASLADGFFGDATLPTGLIAIGALIGLCLAVSDHFLAKANAPFRTHIMPVAVGMYLPFGISAAIFAGGLLAFFTLRAQPRPEATHHRGMLFASGLIAGESLLGVGVALLAAAGLTRFDLGLPIVLSSSLTLAALAGTSLWLFRNARKA